MAVFLVLEPSSQGERQVHEKQGPMVLWLELPQLHSLWNPASHQGEQLWDLPTYLPSLTIFCALNKWHNCS